MAQGALCLDDETELRLRRAAAEAALSELEEGTARSTWPEARRRRIEPLTRMATLLPFGGAEAKVAAGLRTGRERRGHPGGRTTR